MIMTLINDYFRNEFNEYLKLGSTNVKKEEFTTTSCYNDNTQKSFETTSNCEINFQKTVQEQTSVNTFQDFKGNFECDLLKYMLENVLKFEKKKQTDLNGIHVYR